MSEYARRIRPYVEAELTAARYAEGAGWHGLAFRHLERAHVLGQMATGLHTRVHWRMFFWGLKRRDAKECLGQLMRMLGALTKTALGWVPQGNTGGARVSPFASMPVADDLQRIIDTARG